MTNSDFDPLKQAQALAAQLREVHEAQPSFKAWKAAQALVDQLSGNTEEEVGIFNTHWRDATRSRVTPAVRHRARPTQADTASHVIQELNKPLTTPQLLEEVQKRGTRVGGSDPLMVLSSALSKDDRFVSVRWCGDRTWWFKDKPVPGGKDEDDDIQDLLGDTSGVES